MKINIVHLYYDLLNIYGDRGNILILKKVLEESGINCNVKYLSIDEELYPENCDILFMGGGQDLEQVLVGKDLIKNKRDMLAEYIEGGGCGLYICGSFQLLGKRYISADGKEIEGAGILDIYTEKGDSRFIGDIATKSDRLGATMVGFENHSGRTFINEYTPLGKVLVGMGNNGVDGTEGLIYKNTVCTYMHGCCLSKNPEITKFLITNAINNKYNTIPKLNFNNNWFQQAKNDVLKKLM